jgi:hypothetical protein
MDSLLGARLLITGILGTIMGFMIIKDVGDGCLSKILGFILEYAIIFGLCCIIPLEFMILIIIAMIVVIFQR